MLRPSATSWSCAYAARRPPRPPFPSGDADLGVDSAILALRTLFAPSAANGLDASYELRLGEHRFHARVADGRLEIVRAEVPEPDATIETDPGTLSALLWLGRQLDEALRSGNIEIEGDREMVTRFLGLFPLSEPAVPTAGA